MIYFSGFCLENESELFDQFIDPHNPYHVAGFSLGAIHAMHYVLETKNRVEKLLLLSPAFFMNKDEKYKRLQKLYYQKDPQTYCTQFYRNAASPSTYDLSRFTVKGESEALALLLDYVWDGALLERIRERGIMIEVFLGGEDRIIDSQEAHTFFKHYATSYFFKPYGHILQGA